MSTHKILVIDDSKVIRMRVKDMLPEGDFEVLEAVDGLEGYDLMRNERPNLIILDFLLPKMSGWDIYQQIRESPDLERIPLVLMSGRKEEVVEKISEPFEFFSFLEKPFEKSQLADAIRDAMAKAKRFQTMAATGSLNNFKNEQVSAAAEEIAELREKISEMQAEMSGMRTEIDTLKRQLSQVVRFLQQKMAATK